MIKIGAWIYDPTKSLFGDKNGKSALYEVFCEDPKKCDLYNDCGSCLLSSGIGSCKFGRKSSTKGFTKRARAFRSWMSDRRDENKEFIGKLNSLQAWNRIIKMQDHYYIPYPHVDGSNWLSSKGAPLKGKWVPESEMSSGLLDQICNFNPRSMFGDVIRSYQEKEVPKLIWDLKKFYPLLFDLLSEDQKARASFKNAIGRKADITTMPPCDVVISKNKWAWDGKYLSGGSMLFQPVKGDIEIRIKPKKGEGVIIANEGQVNSTTEFVD